MLHLNWEVLYVIVNLLVLYLLLKKFLFGPVTAMMEKRAQKVQDTIREAENKNAEAQVLREQYEQKLAEAQSQASQIVRQAQERAAREYAAILQQAREDASRVMEQAQKSIEQEREQALREVKGRVSGLVLVAAAKLAQKNLDDDANQALVDAFVAEAGGEP